MSVTAGPRDPSLEVKMTFPRKWVVEDSDPLNASNMFIAGLVLVTRNRYLSWPALVITISGLINRHTLRTKEEGNSPWLTLFMACLAVATSHAQMFLITNDAAGTGTQSPLPVQ